ncbi:unnamed protein product [Fasciola hepatica]|uniref:Uncharacterized protein n=1 Tax=Fasciola hepatica TaxID=6192 RepID=A0ABC9HHV2_FASHE|nr:unnamed protein product [Fasciola hepatica]CAK6928391.1 unnamed protein product [Fasciola hepatica]CAK6928392.1 unnamed protein product [Fasciola hepatica]
MLTDPRARTYLTRLYIQISELRERISVTFPSPLFKIGALRKMTAVGFDVNRKGNFNNYMIVININLIHS